MTDEHSGNNGTNGSEGSVAVAEAAKRVITRRSLALPQVGFSDVEPLAEAMVALNGPASREMIFDQAGASARGGTADRKWAALGFFGFRQKAGGAKHEATDRGRALVGDNAEKQREAKQHALVDTGFRPLIQRFRAGPVNEKAIAGVLRGDFAVPEQKAKAAGSLLVELATEAELIDGGAFKAAPIEHALEAVPERTDKPAAPRTVTPKPPQGPARPRAVEPPQAEQLVAQRTLEGEPASEGRSGPFGVSVEITVDAKNHTPEEVGRIVREVREALETKTA